jgi:hypothetical protein
MKKLSLYIFTILAVFLGQNTHAVCIYDCSSPTIGLQTSMPCHGPVNASQNGSYNKISHCAQNTCYMESQSQILQELSNIELSNVNNSIPFISPILKKSLHIINIKNNSPPIKIFNTPLLSTNIPTYLKIKHLLI